MRTIIAGSRTIKDIKAVLSAIEESGFDITTVISGTAKGVDQLGEAIAESLNIPVEKYPADWKKRGKSAGYYRNEEMAKNADALIAIWDCQSRGTFNMIQIAKKHKLKVFVKIVLQEGERPLPNDTSYSYRF